MEEIREEDHAQHEVQQEEIQEKKAASQEGKAARVARKLGYVSKKEMELQVTLERNKYLEECREIRERLEKLEKKQENLMSHKETLSKENATEKEEKRKIEMELQVTLERNKYLEKECREIRERLEKLENKQENLRETLSTENAAEKEEKRKIEMELQVTLERNKSLEKECREIRERLEKLEQKQGDLMSQRKTLLIENVTMKEEKRMQEEEKKCGIKQSENQSQSVEQEVLMSQLTDLKKSKEEEKAKVKDLKQKRRELELQKDQLQEKIRQCDVDKKQNEAIKAEMLDIQKQLQSLSQDVQKAAENEKVVEDRQKEIWKLYENVDQVRSMYELKIEELREEMTRLTSRENLKEVLRQTNEDQSVMTSDIPVLLQKIRPFFVFCVNPLIVLVIIHSHGPRVLVEQDFQEITCVTEQRGNILGASKLLTRLVQYQGWLPCIVKVLRDDRVRRSHVADMIEKVIETIESDEQGAFSSEVKTFLEEKKKQTSQVEMLQKSIEKLHEERQKQEIQVRELTYEIDLQKKEKESADKKIESLQDEIKKKDEEHRNLMATEDDQSSDQCCGNESELHSRRKSCRFVRDHELFIPAKTFSYEHLPESLREDGKMAYIKAVGYLTVRLKVNHTSESRPKNYPCHELRGHPGIKRFGNGLVFQVIKKFGEDNKSTCPCIACKVKKIETKEKWAEFAVVTAALVVYDDIECAQTSCKLWFDDDDNYITTRSISGSRVEKTNKKTPNVRIMHCTTHDEEVSQKLEEKIAHLNNLRGRYYRKSTTKVKERRLAVLISHQHALSKKISVGEAKVKMDDEIKKLSYNVPTCPGSCGAPICILGESQGSGIVTTIHSMGNGSTGFYL